MTPTTPIARCQELYVSGYRAGEPCAYRATAIVSAAEDPFLVCGYHARAYQPRVIYPLDWNLARIRAWSLDNLRSLEKEP